MKIEKVNDNQIRCTLTKEDLADRQLKLSELAYGTEKAKMLFRDMMQQASYEFGFEAEDIPLMIEAIPLSSECIILIITKVECPEELDTRFSRFSQPSDDYADSEDSDTNSLVSEAADGIVDFFRRLHEKQMEAEAKGEDVFIPLQEAISEYAKERTAPKEQKQPEQITISVDLTKLYAFSDLAGVTRLANVLSGFYNGRNILYKNEATRKYYLVISKSSHSPEDFNKVCNILSEYATQEKYTAATEAFFEEHYTKIIDGNALQVLGTL
jgi:adapter protein MecA 1/2